MDHRGYDAYGGYCESRSGSGGGNNDYRRGSARYGDSRGYSGGGGSAGYGDTRGYSGGGGGSGRYSDTRGYSGGGGDYEGGRGQYWLGGGGGGGSGSGRYYGGERGYEREGYSSQRSGYDERGGYSSGYGGSSGSGGYSGSSGSGGYGDRGGYQERGYGSGSGDHGGYQERGYGSGSGDRGGYDDRCGSSYGRSYSGSSGGYGERGYEGGSGYGGSSGSANSGAGGDLNDRGDSGVSGASGRYGPDNGGHGDGMHRGGPGQYGSRHGGERSYSGGGRGRGRGRGRGGGGPRGQHGPGVGVTAGHGYETIGSPVVDPRLHDVWSGRAPARNVRDDDPGMQQQSLFATRPSIGREGRASPLEVNCFSLSLDSSVREMFKYHIDVERSPDVGHCGPASSHRSATEKDVTMAETSGQEDVEMRDTTEPPKRPERPLPRTLVRAIINAAMRQYESEFGGIRVVHDGMSALYSPGQLPWEEKNFVNVNPDAPHGGGNTEQRQGGRGPRTFVVKMKLVETVSQSSLEDYFGNPDGNPVPMLQALDIVARHLSAQRLIAVGRNFFTMKKTHPLRGGKELCWGYHQALKMANGKLLMNVDQAATVFYTPGPLMDLVVAAMNVRDAREIRHLSDRDTRNLSRALRKIEVVPTHRTDRKKPIFGISSTAADATMVTIKGREMSVAAYFQERYNNTLRFPHLPLVNLSGSKKDGRQQWVPIELCEVAPGQRCPNINDFDTAEIIKQTSQPPRTRQSNIMEQVRQAGFENDPYLSAFGMKVDLRMERVDGRILDAPEVQYENVSERPVNGAWNLRDKKFVHGAVLQNWGVVVHANVAERAVTHFIQTLCDVARRSGLDVRDDRPVMIHMDQHRGAQVEELMSTCAKELDRRDRGPPQLIMVIKQDKNSGSYGDIKRMSDTVLGIPSQCIVSANIPKANPQYCANVCMKINMKLSGKNSILREHLPLISTAPTIVIGADVEHPRSGVGFRPSIASVVASIDRYSARYVARVSAQKSRNDINQLPGMLRDLFLAYYQSTSRKPEHVVYYRDGVSEGEMFSILQAEMRAVRKACKMISEDYNPPVTFIVVNKRHHLRAFAQSSQGTDHKGNIIPGTVVDTGVVDSHRFDFFLYGHAGIQGTSVPAHYTVLHDENKLSADDIQRLTYHLGYTFSRCTRSVSFTTPVYYAHLAAARARFFLNETSDGVSSIGSWATSHESRSSSGSSCLEFCDVHKALESVMFFI